MNRHMEKKSKRACVVTEGDAADVTEVNTSDDDTMETEIEDEIEAEIESKPAFNVDAMMNMFAETVAKKKKMAAAQKAKAKEVAAKNKKLAAAMSKKATATKKKATAMAQRAARLFRKGPEKAEEAEEAEAMSIALAEEAEALKDKALHLAYLAKAKKDTANEIEAKEAKEAEANAKAETTHVVPRYLGVGARYRIISKTTQEDIENAMVFVVRAAGTTLAKVQFAGLHVLQTFWLAVALEVAIGRFHTQRTNRALLYKIETANRDLQRGRVLMYDATIKDLSEEVYMLYTDNRERLSPDLIISSDGGTIMSRGGFDSEDDAPESDADEEDDDTDDESGDADTDDDRVMEDNEDLACLATHIGNVVMQVFEEEVEMTPDAREFMAHLPEISESDDKAHHVYTTYVAPILKRSRANDEVLMKWEAAIVPYLESIEEDVPLAQRA